MTAPTPRPLRGRGRAARVDRAYRELRAAIREERKACARLERARVRYLEATCTELKERGEL